MNTICRRKSARQNNKIFGPPSDLVDFFQTSFHAALVGFFALPARSGCRGVAKLFSPTVPKDRVFATVSQATESKCACYQVDLFAINLTNIGAIILGKLA